MRRHSLSVQEANLLYQDSDILNSLQNQIIRKTFIVGRAFGTDKLDYLHFDVSDTKMQD